jgi:small subunit ribosomal protein S1
MKDYENELEASFRKIEEGDIVKGTVVSVDETEVTLDLNYFTAGVISLADFSREPGFSLKERVNVGDEVQAVVKNKDDHGKMRLSRVEANDVLSWQKLKAWKDSKEVIDVVVKSVVKGGAVAYLEDVRGFIPASKISLDYVENLEEFLGKTIQVQVIDVDEEGKKLVLSARDVLRRKAREEQKNVLSSIQVGFVGEGTVETLQPYGAFVRLDNGASGLVHVSQIAPRRIKEPSEVLSVGDKVKVKVIKIKEGKLSLSIKDAENNTPLDAPEEKVVIPVSGEEATTSLGSLFDGLDL